ncbi:MAG: leucine-rich repeat domain-containing protein [Bacteroidales bacterium]|nr:leucine-rich repeat domain-containing protein [Bacteroidales bacterium]
MADPKTAVTVTAPNGTFEPGANYYIITLPDVPLPNGYKVTLRRADGYQGTYELRANRPLNRIKFRNLSDPIDVRIESAANIEAGTSTGWVQSTTQGINEIWYTTSDGQPVTYTVDGSTGNEVDTDNCVAPADNGGTGIIRFKAPITEIDDEAFAGSSNLTGVTMPQTVEYIGYNSFFNCVNLTTVNLGNGLKRIEEGAFYDCTLLSEIDLPEGLEWIGGDAFANCALTEVTIPSTVEWLGYGKTGVYLGSPFIACQSLQSFSGKYASEDGRCLIVDGNLIAFASGGMEGETYSIPDGTIRIHPWAFYGATISHVAFPSSVTSINQYAFTSAELKDLTIPATVSSVYQFAFSYCRQLEWVKILKAGTVLSTDTGHVFDDTNDCPIYVPAVRLKHYKNEQFWDAYEARYQPLPEDNKIFYTTTDGEAVTYTVSGDTGNELVASGCKAPKDNNGIGIIQFSAPITKVDAEALSEEVRLLSVILPDTVEEICEGAFSSCENLADVLLGVNLKHIYPDAFSYTAISKIDFPEGLESIDYLSFEGCDNLQEVRIPDSVQYLGFYGNTFSGNPFFMCRNLTSFSGKFATEDGKCLVFTSGALVSLAPSGMNGQTYTLPSEVTRISALSMAYSTLKKAILPSGVTRINRSAFYASIIENVTMPESVQQIGESAFANCSQLSSVKMEGAVPPALSVAVFVNTPSNMEIEVPGAGYNAYITAAGWSDYESQIVAYQTNKEIWYSLVDGDTSTPADFSAYTDINLLSNNYFQYTSGTTKIYPAVDMPESVEQTNIFVASFDGSVSSIPKQVFSSNSIKAKIQYVSMPNTVTTVGDYAFDGCSNLLRWPFRKTNSGGPSITSVGNWAFNNCLSMIGDEISWIHGYDSAIYLGYLNVTIGNYAFKDCDKIEAFAGNVTSLGEFSFQGCANLASVQVGAITTIPTQAFSDCESLVKFSESGTVTSIASYAFRNCKKLTSASVSNIIYFPDVTSIGAYAFYGCEKIQTAMFGAVTSIGADAFYGCSDLRSVELASTSSLTSIGASCFWNATSFKSIGSASDISSEVINLPNLTTLGGSAFGSSAIKHATFPSLATVNQSTFTRCGSLEYLDLPAVTSIGHNAFEYTRSLATLKLGPGLNSIGMYIFADSETAYRNSGKMDVYFYGPLPSSIHENAFRYTGGSDTSLFLFKKIHTTSADVQDYQNQWQVAYGPIVGDL